MALDAAMLAKLDGLKVRARAVVEGVLSGQHKSPLQGQSVEFDQHKEYAPGDELRHLDWKALARFDKYYVKRFEHETNLRAVMVVDASGSMGFGSIAMNKLDVARTLAAALSYLLVRQTDAAGLAIVSKGQTFDLPARASHSHLAALLDRLETTQAHGTTDLFTAADHLAETLHRRSLVLVFSDCFDDRDEALSRVLALRARKHDVALFHILDPAELEFPYEDPTLFTSLEDDRKLECNPRDIKDSYLEELNRFLEDTRRRCTQNDVDYERVRTDQPLDQVLLHFLAGRLGRSKGRR